MVSTIAYVRLVYPMSGLLKGAPMVIISDKPNGDNTGNRLLEALVKKAGYEGQIKITVDVETYNCDGCIRNAEKLFEGYTNCPFTPPGLEPSCFLTPLHVLQK